MPETLDQATFKSIFEDNFSGLQHFIYYKIGDMAVAQDLAQEAFMKLWQNREKVKMETVKSYLFTIGANLAINHGKHQQIVLAFKHGELKQSTPSTHSPQYLLELKEFDEKLHGAIAGLPEKLRVVFLMHRVDKLKHVEIAEKLELSVKGVQKRLKRALELLNEKIKYRL